jgi:hypothetical protein
LNTAWTIGTWVAEELEFVGHAKVYPGRVHMRNCHCRALSWRPQLNGAVLR